MQAFEQLEKEWAVFNDLNPAKMVCCSSGTSALALAFETLRLPQGSAVLVPDFSMIACPRSVSMAGLTPMFVDCKENLSLDNTLLNRAIEQQTKAALLVHIYGRVCSAECGAIAGERGLKIVEDMAELHKPIPQSCLSRGSDALCWSFFSNKIVHGEEGGAVYFKDREHAKLARMLRCQGFTEAHDFWHVPRGHNYRLSNANAELVLTSLRRYVADLDGHGPTHRRKVESWYDECCPDEWRMPERAAIWVYDIRVPGLNWDKQLQVVRLLNETGIAARCSFKPMSLQKEYRGHRRVSRMQGSSVAELMSNEVLYLPVNEHVTKESAKRAFEIIKGAVSNLEGKCKDVSVSKDADRTNRTIVSEMRQQVPQ